MLIKDGQIPCCEIEDRPRFPFRGIHHMMPPINEFGFTKRLVKYMLSPMGYNNIILELGGAMEYKKHPDKAIVKIEYIGNNEFDTDTYVEQIEAVF